LWLGLTVPQSLDARGQTDADDLVEAAAAENGDPEGLR
jgi:hypothetical protein